MLLEPVELFEVGNVSLLKVDDDIVGSNEWMCAIKINISVDQNK